MIFRILFSLLKVILLAITISAWPTYAMYQEAQIAYERVTIESMQDIPYMAYSKLQIKQSKPAFQVVVDGYNHVFDQLFPPLTQTTSISPEDQNYHKLQSAT